MWEDASPYDQAGKLKGWNRKEEGAPSHEAVTWRKSTHDAVRQLKRPRHRQRQALNQWRSTEPAERDHAYPAKKHLQRAPLRKRAAHTVPTQQIAYAITGRAGRPVIAGNASLSAPPSDLTAPQT
ncbi:hypothetical protein MyNCGM152_58480 [Achromobacter xylosoxidans]